MPQDDYERYRKRLEEQLHSDIGLLYEAFHAQLPAHPTIPPSPGGELHLDPELHQASGRSPVLPRAPAGFPAPPAPPPRSEPASVIDALREVLPRLTEDFDKFDVLQAL